MATAWVRARGPGHESLPWTGVHAPLLRVHELEEMVKDQETTAEQALEEEVRRHREAYGKLEREKSTEIELLHTRWARRRGPVADTPVGCWGSPVGQLLPPRLVGGEPSWRQSLVPQPFHLGHPHTWACALGSV